MADPTLQTFCCIRNNATRLGVDDLLRYHYEPYNVICIISSLLGVLGASYQILPRYHEGSGRLSASYLRGRQIIVWLAMADLLASLAVFIRSTSWLFARGYQTNMSYYVGSLFCAISSGWIQYFYTATSLWTLCYAIDVLRVVQGLPAITNFYHSLVWGFPAFSVFIGLFILYFPDMNCHDMASNPYAKILPNFLLTYLPIALVMIVNPILYYRASKQAEKYLISTSGRFTTSERRQLRILRLKFFSINFVYVVCWIPNLMNAITVWTLWSDLPRNSLFVSIYLMALLNPLQALLNACVYRKWGDSSLHIRFPWSKSYTPSERLYLLDQDADNMDSYQNEVSNDNGKNLAINGYNTM